MPPLHDHLGNAVELGTAFAAGGEGTVYALPGDATHLAKIYHQRPPGPKVEKLKWMASHASAELCRTTAWPTGTLHDSKGGPLVGFLMPRFDGFRPIHTLYSPAHRRVSFPEADWAFLIAAAMNCAAAIDAVHEQGHVIGDVNQSNVLVSRQALACLIDCDSFQVRAAGKVYRSEVGVGPYTPSELQGVNFRDVDRTANHDRFGLAVLIFHLLFMGRHPFAGRYLGSGDMSIEQAIKEYRFVYSQVNSETKMAAPPFSLPLRALSQALAQLFERAFNRGAEKPDARPTAAAWHTALGEFRGQLRTCPKDSGHKVPLEWVECPWCGFLERGGPNFFLGVGVDGAAYQVDAALLHRLLEQLKALKPQAFPRPALVLSATAQPPPPPGPLARFGARLARLKLTPLVACVGWIALIWLLVVAGLFDSSGCINFGRFFVVLYLAGLAWSMLRPRVERFEKWMKARLLGPEAARVAEGTRLVNELHALNADWDGGVRRYEEAFRRVKDGMRAAKKEADTLQPLFLAERLVLEKTAALRHAQEQLAANVPADPEEEAKAFEHFLRNCFLSDHKIPGFGTGRLTLLVSYGVETAFDLTEENLQEIRGIGPKLRQTLLSWKEQMLRTYRYDPGEVIPGTKLALVPPEEMRALMLKSRQREEQLRSQLQKSIQDLTSLSRHVEQELLAVAQKRNDVASRSVQAGVAASTLPT